MVDNLRFDCILYCSWGSFQQILAVRLATPTLGGKLNGWR